jgi:hypothetical protein
VTKYDDNQIHDDDFVFVLSPVKEFRINLVKDFDQRKLVVKLRDTYEVVKRALCRNHNIELWASEKKYYCLTKMWPQALSEYREDMGTMTLPLTSLNVFSWDCPYVRG